MITWIAITIGLCVISFIVGGVAALKRNRKQARYQYLLGRFVEQQINISPIGLDEMLAVIVQAADNATYGRSVIDFRAYLDRVRTSEFYKRLHER